MTPEARQYINDHTAAILGCSFVACTLIMQLLHALKVNVLKVVVLIGTFSLAMAFCRQRPRQLHRRASQRIRVLSGLYGQRQRQPLRLYDGALNGPADTPLYFLIGAGVIMVVSLATSKSAERIENRNRTRQSERRRRNVWLIKNRPTHCAHIHIDTLMGTAPHTAQGKNVDRPAF